MINLCCCLFLVVPIFSEHILMKYFFHEILTEYMEWMELYVGEI